MMGSNPFIMGGPRSPRPLTPNPTRYPSLPWSKITPSLAPSAAEDIHYPKTPEGEIRFQLDKLTECLEHVIKGAKGRYSPYCHLRNTDVTSPHQFFILLPGLQDLVSQLADYVDSVVDENVTINSLIGSIERGELQAKFLAPPLVDSEGMDMDGTNDHILLEPVSGTAELLGSQAIRIYKACRSEVWWVEQDPELEGYNGPIMMSVVDGKVEYLTITEEDYQRILKAVEDCDGFKAELRERVKEFSASQEWRDMVAREYAEADEILHMDI